MKKIITVMLLIFFIVVTVFAGSVEVSFLGNYIPGYFCDYGDPDSSGFCLLNQNCIGAKARSAYIGKKIQPKIELGGFFSAELNLFNQASLFKTGKQDSLGVSMPGMQLKAENGLIINFLTESEQSFFVCHGAFISFSFADFISKTGVDKITFRNFDFGICVSGGYRIWIPNGRLAFEAGLSLYWCPVSKIWLENIFGNSYGTVSAEVFAGICSRFGAPLFVPSP